MESNIKSFDDAKELLKSLGWKPLSYGYDPQIPNRYYKSVFIKPTIQLMPSCRTDKQMILESDMLVHIEGVDESFTLEQFIILYC